MRRLTAISLICKLVLTVPFALALTGPAGTGDGGPVTTLEAGPGAVHADRELTANPVQATAASVGIRVSDGTKIQDRTFGLRAVESRDALLVGKRNLIRRAQLPPARARAGLLGPLERPAFPR